MIDKEELVRLRKVNGLSQPQLGKKSGCSQQLIAALESGATRSTKFLPRIAAALDVSPGQLDPDYAQLGASPTPPTPLMGGRDFPVHTAVEGGKGQVIISTDPIDYMERPAVANSRGAYGLYVVGESMVPEYRPGDIALVDPHLPIVPDEAYIFYSQDKAEETRATIKHLRRSSSAAWLLRQWNPLKDFSLPRKEWPVCHRVVGKYSRR